MDVYRSPLRTICNADFLAEHHPLTDYLDSLPVGSHGEFRFGDFVLRRYGVAGIEVLGTFAENFVASEGHDFPFFPVPVEKIDVERDIRRAAYMAERAAYSEPRKETGHDFWVHR